MAKRLHPWRRDSCPGQEDARIINKSGAAGSRPSRGDRKRSGGILPPEGRGRLEAARPLGRRKAEGGWKPPVPFDPVPSNPVPSDSVRLDPGRSEPVSRSGRRSTFGSRRSGLGRTIRRFSNTRRRCVRSRWPRFRRAASRGRVRSWSSRSRSGGRGRGGP